MRLLIDANVILDVLLDREGAERSEQVIHRCRGRDDGWVSWHTLSILSYYIGKRHSGRFREIMEEMLAWAHVAETTDLHARMALQWAFRDFEDAMQASAAVACGAGFIITGNIRDFTKSPVPALSPEDYLQQHP